MDLSALRWRALVLAALVTVAPASAQSSVAGVLRDRLSQVDRRAGARVRLEGESVPIEPVVLDVYRQNGYAPLWADPATRLELSRALDELPADGLDPGLYHPDKLRALADTSGPAAAAELDLLRTSALAEMIHDLSEGRARPALGGIGPDFVTTPLALDAPQLAAIVRSGRIRDALASVRPRHFVYQGLRAGLDDLRRIVAAGGWGTVPVGRELRRDSTDARIPALRRRLSREGYAAADSGDAALFDEHLERAVTSFQHHHGLNEDGVAGARTLAELNVPGETRIDQLRVNLERTRWLRPDLPQRFVVVNTAGAKAYLVDGQQVVFETRAIVGKQYTKTPLFSATLRTVELDPTWTVPPGIVREVLAEIRKDPGYLARLGIRVLDHAGRFVDPSTIDFARYTGATFPYTFRQDPGPLNPLGRIKLLFPNRNNVYLHDTPDRDLFAREERTFSHGCIRIADPFGLAALVLDDPAWPHAALEAHTGTARTTVLRVAHPLPVLVFYWTASADERGELHFYRDRDRRDAPVLETLGGPTPPGAQTPRD